MGKKFNFWNDIVKPTEKLADRAAKTLAPVAKPIIRELTGKAVQAVKALPVQQAVQAGAVAAFKTGGRVPGKRGRARIAKVHGGEYVLPANAKPTKAQIKIVAKNKARARKRK